MPGSAKKERHIKGWEESLKRLKSPTAGGDDERSELKSVVPFTVPYIIT